MRFDPSVADEHLLPEGWYDAVCIAAQEKISKKGNDMLVMTATVYGPGVQVNIDTYFVSTAQPSMTRLKKFCNSIGVPFGGGEITPAMVLNKNFKALVKTQEGTGSFDDKNVIAAFARPDWTPPGGESSPEAAELPGSPVDTVAPTGDEIPF